MAVPIPSKPLERQSVFVLIYTKECVCSIFISCAEVEMLELAYPETLVGGLTILIYNHTMYQC